MVPPTSPPYFGLIYAVKAFSSSYIQYWTKTKFCNKYLSKLRRRAPRNGLTARLASIYKNHGTVLKILLVLEVDLAND